MHFPLTHLRRTSVSPFPPGAALSALLRSNLPNPECFSRSLSRGSRFQVIIPLSDALRGSKGQGPRRQGKQDLPPCHFPTLGVPPGPGPAARPPQSPGLWSQATSQEASAAMLAGPWGREAPSRCHLRSTHAFWRPWPALRPMHKAGPPLPGKRDEAWARR